MVAGDAAQSNVIRAEQIISRCRRRSSCRCCHRSICGCHLGGSCRSGCGVLHSASAYAIRAASSSPEASDIRRSQFLSRDFLFLLISRGRRIVRPQRPVPARPKRAPSFGRIVKSFSGSAPQRPVPAQPKRAPSFGHSVQYLLGQSAPHSSAAPRRIV